MSQQLKDHLESNPQIENVYLNTKGEWQFHKRAGFEKVMSREQVLATEFKSDGSENANPEEILIKTKPGKLIPIKGAAQTTVDDDADDAEKAMAALIEVENERDALKSEKAKLEAELAALKKAAVETKSTTTKAK